MTTIWKYRVNPDMEAQIFELPINAEVLSFGLDGNEDLCFWAAVHPDLPTEKRHVWCVGTGWPLMFNKEKYWFVGTVTHGAYVWHLFVEDKDEYETNCNNR